MASTGVEAFLQRQRSTGAVYRELPPSADLAPFVACGWVGVVRRHAGTPPMPVIPDGCADIIICDDGAPLLAGPDTQARWPELPNGMVITGLRLRPGALKGMLGCPAVELVNASVRLSDVTPASRRLHASLQSAETLGARLAVLEQWVRDRMRIEARDLAVIHACRWLSATPSAEMAQLATELGWSARRLHREFIAACGYGPKTMQRILRVQRVLRVAHRTSRPLRLSAVAASAGFADQAHMTREFRSLTGLTPASYLARSQPGLSRWLDADWAD